MDIERALAVPKSFRAIALAFPQQVERALARLDTAAGAKELLDRSTVLEQYARRIKEDTETINAIAFGKLKIAAKLGELMAPTPRAATGRGHKKSASVGEALFAAEATARYRKIAAHQSQIDAYYEMVKDANGELLEITLGGFLRFATGSEKTGFAAHLTPQAGISEWYTPAEYLNAARQVLGGIDLDPASCVMAQRRVRAKRFYTLAEDGLTRKWQGKVWLNPPYTAELVGRFTAKLCAHYLAGDVPAALLLVNNATETHWFQDAAHLATALCFPRGRIRFLDGNGHHAGTPLQGQTVLYFGRNRKQFEKAFASFGFCRWAHRRTKEEETE
jgi:hypothetical protein